MYVDGFSLYYSALRRTPYKWLDLRKLCRLLLPNDRIHRIRYFTAIPIYEWGDAPRGQRLQAYVRALETLRGLTVHYGTSRAENRRLPLPGSDPETEFVTARRTKGIDVQLASLMLADGFRGDYEVAVVPAAVPVLVPLPVLVPVPVRCADQRSLRREEGSPARAS